MSGDPDERIALPQSYLDQPRWWHGGADWLDGLPAAVQAQCRRWGLVVDGPVQHGSNAIVVPVDRSGEPLSLRMVPPGVRTATETDALRFWGGRGTARLIDADPGPAAMLLERVVPGSPASLLPVAECMAVLGVMMRRLAVPAPAWAPSTADIARERARSLASDWARLGRPFGVGVLRAARRAAEDLGTACGDLAVNGDLHADQVLRATREPWLTVDPLLYRGDIEYDLARCLWTRLDEMADDSEIAGHLATLVDAAGLDGGRARSWVVFRTVDYWLWALDAGLTEDPRRCARLVAALTG